MFSQIKDLLNSIKASKKTNIAIGLISLEMPVNPMDSLILFDQLHDRFYNGNETVEDVVEDVLSGWREFQKEKNTTEK